MNGKLLALGAFALVTVGLVAWLLMSPAPVDMEDGDGEVEAVEAGHEGSGVTAADRKVRKARQTSEKPENPAPQRIALPSGLPSLKVAEAQGEPPPAEPVEPPAEPHPNALIEEQDRIVQGRALETAMRCWHEVREQHPAARGEYMARLHLGASDGGRVIVQNLELDELGEGHPELAGCLDRELMRLDLDLPDGVQRIVNAPLRLLPEGDPGVAAGTVHPPPEYGRPHENKPPADHPPPPIPEGALPEGVQPNVQLRPGEAAPPPPGAMPGPEPPMPPEPPEVPPEHAPAEGTAPR